MSQANQRDSLWRAVNHILLWKGAPSDRYVATALTTALMLRSRGVDQFAADDVDDSFLGPEDRNVIGACWKRMSSGKLIVPVLELIPGTQLPFLTSGKQTIQVTRESEEEKAHGNPIGVWKVQSGLANAWLQSHGYVVPKDESQMEMMMA